MQRAPWRGLRDAHVDDRGVGAGGEEGVECLGHPGVAVDVADHGNQTAPGGRLQQAVDQRGVPAVAADSAVQVSVPVPGSSRVSSAATPQGVSSRRRCWPAG